MTGEHEPRRRTDRDLIAESIYEWEASDRVGTIDDRAARVIASHWHGGQTSALYSFVSTGRIDKEGVTVELVQAIKETDPYDEESNEQLEALTHYFIEHGERDAVEGWHQSTKWGAS